MPLSIPPFPVRHTVSPWLRCPTTNTLWCLLSRPTKKKLLPTHQSAICTLKLSGSMWLPSVVHNVVTRQPRVTIPSCRRRWPNWGPCHVYLAISPAHCPAPPPSSSSSGASRTTAPFMTSVGVCPQDCREYLKTQQTGRTLLDFIIFSTSCMTLVLYSKSPKAIIKLVRGTD